MRRKRTLEGVVIGHSVKYLPQQIVDCGSGVSLVKRPKIAAYVAIQVDNKKIYTVPCRESERILKDGEDQTEEMHHEVNGVLVEKHPFRSERVFLEIGHGGSEGKHYKIGG